MAASDGEGFSVCGKVSDLPARIRTGRGRIFQPSRTCSEPWTATGQDRGAGLERQPADAAMRDGERAPPDPGALGKDAERAAALEDAAGGLERLAVGLPAPDRVGAEPVEDPALPRRLEELDLGDVVHGPAPRQHRPEDERVEEAAVVGGDDQAAVDRCVLLAEALQPEPDQERRLQDAAGDEVDDPVDALGAGVLVVGGDAVGADPLGGAGLRRPPGLLLARAVRGRRAALSLPCRTPRSGTRGAPRSYTRSARITLQPAPG